MRHVLFALFLVAACATIAAADPIEDAEAVYNRGDYTRAARLFRPLAEQGHAKAQFNLGVMYAGVIMGTKNGFTTLLNWLS